MRLVAAVGAALCLAACTTSSANPDSIDSTALDEAGGDGAVTVVGEGATGQPAEPAATAVADTTAAPEPSDAPTTTAPAPSLSVPTGDEWQVVFFDDFDGNTLGEVWNTCHWWQVDGGCTIASNGERQWYRPEGVSLGEGDLRLRASADPQRTTDGEVLPFRSGMVTTGPRDNDDETSSFAFTYGEVSVRAMVPAGAGTWPAVWLLSADRTSLPEIDVFEWYGSRPDQVTSHVHNRIDGERAKERVETEVSDFAGVWHTFTMTWLPDRVVFTVDGVETGRVTDHDLIPTTPMYLVANLAMGGEAGDVDGSELPLTFRIDEIVVSQWSGR